MNAYEEELEKQYEYERWRLENEEKANEEKYRKYKWVMENLVDQIMLILSAWLVNLLLGVSLAWSIFSKWIHYRWEFQL